MNKNILITGCLLWLAFSGCIGKTTHATRQQQVLLLQPLNNFPDSLLPAISTRIQEVYGFNVTVASLRQLPQRFFNADKGPRYCADSILRLLLQTKPDTIQLITGLTTVDIFTSKVPAADHKYPLGVYKNWGIMGLGFQPGKSNVVSVHRLGQGQLLKNRVLKIVIHEIGHNLGLAHCPHPRCVMNDAMESIRTIDLENDTLCDACAKSIH